MNSSGENLPPRDVSLDELLDAGSVDSSRTGGEYPEEVLAGIENTPVREQLTPQDIEKLPPIVAFQLASEGTPVPHNVWLTGITGTPWENSQARRG